jgi:hypothetical protein
MKSARFHIADGRLVKTSNGEPIPEDEPVIVLRARDHLAVPLLRIYRELAVLDGCNDWFLGEIDRDQKAFEAFAADHPDRMKQPGVTRGR